MRYFLTRFEYEEKTASEPYPLIMKRGRDAVAD